MKNLILENVRIMFKNFEGRADKYNREGDRNFAVVIEDPSYAQDLNDEGWSVKCLKPRSEDEEPLYYIPVAVKMNGYTNVKLVTRKDIQNLDEDTVGMLDNVDVAYADLTLRPYEWNVRGESGVKAYLKTMYAVLNEDDFADKYERRDSVPRGPIGKRTIFIPAHR